MNAREWDLILLEVEQEFQELLAEMEAEWIGNRVPANAGEVVSGEEEKLPRQAG